MSRKIIGVTVGTPISCSKIEKELGLAEYATKEWVKETIPAGVVEDASGEVITLTDSGDKKLKGLRVFGKTTQNGTPTPDAPVPLESVGDGGSVGVTVAGKNLIPYPYANGTYKDNMNGVSYTVRDDGGISCFGTPTANSCFILYEGKPFKKKITLSIGGTIKNMSARIVMHTSETVDTYTHTIQCYIGGSVTVDFSQYPDIKRIVVGIWRGGNGQEISGIAYVQVESGDNATEYAVPLAQQSLTIQKPEDVPVFLPGIPVTSGGNYTDENGQQWICDEVDFERGVYVQRVGCVDLGTLEWRYFVSYGNYFKTKISGLKLVGGDTKLNVINSYGYKVVSYNDTWVDLIISLDSSNEFTIRNEAYTNAASFKTAMSGVMLYYELTETVEHILSADELAQYSALHTNLPNTTIYNDAGAGMEVKYVADTKSYIDKKFAELAAAIVNS